MFDQRTNSDSNDDDSETPTEPAPEPRLRRRSKPVLLSVRADSDVHRTIYKIFESIRPSEIRQASGRQEQNAGELTPFGTSLLIEACKLTPADVFVDVGSGIGNVVAQVAIEADVAASIGIEVRKDVAALGKSRMDAFIDLIPALGAVIIHDADIKEMRFEIEPWSSSASVLYCHNTLFSQPSQFAVERMCCNLPRLDVVVLQQPFCFRHRESCARDFCAMFKRDPLPLKVPVSYTGTMTSFHVYRRQVLSI
ncbi:hypothetical protein ATCC90586_010943 [Pythium insidiosum]|nr:hypothetical protein ATCC90586_010943 [Pythium insidiosum]